MIGRGARWLRNAILGMLGLTGAATTATASTDPEFIKAQLPRSAFTKSGPGVRASLRNVLKGMTVEQRQVAYARGWSKGLCTSEGHMVP